MESWWLLSVHILGLIVSGHVILFGRTSEGTLAWVLSLIFLPYISLPLYWLFGHQRFRGYLRVRRQGDNQLSQQVSSMFNYLTHFKKTERLKPETIQLLNRVGPYEFTSGNKLRLLINGESTFEEIFKQIELAKQYLLVQFYLIRDDRIGTRFQQALIDAANRGVRVYLLYDEIGSHQLSGKYIEKLQNEGVQVAHFNTFYRRNRFQINFRNHRKVLVRDGHWAMLGGHNIGDEYLGVGVKNNHWRDTHLSFGGPSVLYAQLAFFEDWYWATDTLIKLDWNYEDNESNQSENTESDPQHQATIVEDDATMLVLPTGPADGLESCSLAFTHLINGAKKELTIVSPYFVPDRRVLGAIQLAALRGVTTRVLIPRHSDNEWVRYSSLSFMEELINCGVEVHAYTKGILHQKAMVIDQSISVIGTVNLDNRSLNINFEISGIILSESFADHFNKILAEDFANSNQITHETVAQWRWYKVLFMRLMRLFAPIQ